MLVGQEGGLTSSCVLENTCDPAAILCAFLMAKRGWSRSRIALTLGVPPLVVEECIRSGVSSAALRKQMAHWVTEYREEALPPLLVRAVLNAVPKTRPTTTTTTTTLDCQEDDEPFAALDPVTRSLFLELSSSVGQSFMSILKDPREGRGNDNNNSWGSWLGNVVFGAADGGHGRGTDSGTVNIGSSLSSSESLLARYNLQEDFSSYLQIVSAPYNVNREEGRLCTSIASTTNTQISNTDGSSLVPENFPWPSDVPDEFFKSFYDPQNELWLLEQKIEERMKEREDNEKVDDPGNSETFTDDFEVIESRMKELRKWENAVEHCLLYHVQSRSEEFFSTSHELGDRAAEAESTLKDLQQTRADISVFGKSLVQEMMLIAKRYRTRNNLRALRDLAEAVTSVSSQVAAVENWVALPERDMMELPFVVENYCAIQDAITPENVMEKNNRKKTSSAEEVLMMKLTALRDLPQRVMQVKEKLCVMIIEEMEAGLIPNIRNDVDDGCVARAFLSAVDMGIWPTAVKHCRDQLLESLWMTVRETFIAFIMSNCTLSDHTANTLLSTAVSARSLREEKLALLSHCNSCRFPVYMQLLSKIMDHILEFVNEAAQRWGFLLVESTPNSNKSNDNNNNNENSSLPTTEDTKKYLSMLCVGAEGIVAMLLEVRSQQGKVPTNVRELEALVSVGCNFLPNMINELQQVLSVCRNISDSRIFISGKQLKSAVTKLTKEHFRSHHMETIEKLRVTIENETWQRESVDAAFQSCVDVLCRSDDMAITELQTRAIFTDVTSGSRQKSLLLSATSTTTTTMSQEKNVVNTEETLENNSKGEKNILLLLPPIGEHPEGRVVSGSLLLLIEMLRDYDDYLGRFPFLAFDIMGKMYDLLRLYDSQCAALLLGAMAVENGVLQTITMQHMAIASQNLGFLYDAIPLMQKRWLRATSADRLPPSTCDDMARVRKDCWTFRCELFGKISALVREKVDGLGTVSAEQWQTSGNEWVMTMLREVARLMRALKPLMPAEDCRGVVVPLLGTFARMIRAVTLSPIVDADLRAIMESDVIVFKTNVEKFGFDVLRCAALYASITESMKAPVEPCSSEESVVAWFFSRDESS